MASSTAALGPVDTTMSLGRETGRWGSLTPGGGGSASGCCKQISCFKTWAIVKTQLTERKT